MENKAIYANLTHAVNDLGRVLLPQELRKVCNIQPEGSVNVYIRDGSIFIYNTSQCPYQEVYTRKVDDLGRVVLPKDLMQVTNIHPGDHVGFIHEDGGIQLVKTFRSCLLCYSSEDIHFIGQEKSPVCSSCIAAIQNMRPVQ